MREVAREKILFIIRHVAAKIEKISGGKTIGVEPLPWAGK